MTDNDPNHHFHLNNFIAGLFTIFLHTHIQIQGKVVNAKENCNVDVFQLQKKLVLFMYWSKEISKKLILGCNFNCRQTFERTAPNWSPHY